MWYLVTRGHSVESVDNGKTEVALDSGVTEDIEMSVVSEVSILREEFEAVGSFRHLPTPQPNPGPYTKVHRYFLLIIDYHCL